MLVLGKHLVIPKPFGPRMKPKDAEAVLTRVFKRLNRKTSVVLPPPGETRWIEPGEPIERVVCFYTDAPTAADRDNIIDHIKNPATALTASNLALVAAKAVELAAANTTNATLVMRLGALLAAGAVPSWQRLRIADNKVDVVEAYILSVLTPLGVTVHFVDDWHYHINEGEAHCATNCLREMPEATDSRRWWDSYDPSIDIRYSP
jgi:hypothetical protein